MRLNGLAEYATDYGQIPINFSETQQTKRPTCSQSEYIDIIKRSQCNFQNKAMNTPSASHAPSTWYDDVATPQRNPSGNVSYKKSAASFGGLYIVAVSEETELPVEVIVQPLQKSSILSTLECKHERIKIGYCSLVDCFAVLSDEFEELTNLRCVNISFESIE